MSRDIHFVDLCGKILPEDEALIPAVSKSAAYGAGCFETLRSYKGKFFRFDEHAERLHNGMNQLGIWDESMETSTLKNRIRDLLQQNDLMKTDARIRIQAGVTGSASYHPPKKNQLYSLITVTKLNETAESGYTLFPVSRKRIPADALDPAVKWTQNIGYMLAMQEAKQNGFDDALMLSQQGFVSETAIANIFWKKDGIVYTPGLSADILPGITRRAVIHLLRSSGTEIREGNYPPEHLLSADEIWITNSIKELVYVDKIGDSGFQPGKSSPKYSETSLKSRLKDLIESELEF